MPSRSNTLSKTPTQRFTSRVIARAIELAEIAPCGERYDAFTESLGRAKRALRLMERTGEPADDVLAEIERLPNGPREVVELELLGARPNEVAAELGLSLDAVDRRRRRGVKALRKRFGLEL